METCDTNYSTIAHELFKLICPLMLCNSSTFNSRCSPTAFRLMIFILQCSIPGVTIKYSSCVFLSRAARVVITTFQSHFNLSMRQTTAILLKILKSIYYIYLLQIGKKLFCPSDKRKCTRYFIHIYKLNQYICYYIVYPHSILDTAYATSVFSCSMVSFVGRGFFSTVSVFFSLVLSKLFTSEMSALSAMMS